MPMSQQIDLYSSVYEDLVEELGSDAAQAHLSKSLFLVVVGSNDIFSYYGSGDVHNKTSPQQFVELMASTFESQLKHLYRYGARKYAISGVALVGCTPSQRRQISGGECKDEMNYWAGEYNIILQSLLQRLEMELDDFAYSYADVYAIMSDFIQKPSSYGFEQIKAACCGLGNLNALIPCIPLAFLCPNRDNHLFWDPFHPTQQANHIIVDYIFDGSNFTYPYNIKELIAKPTKNIEFQYY